MFSPPGRCLISKRPTPRTQVRSSVLPLCVDVDGQAEGNTCAARRVARSPQASAMRFNDRSADAKSHAGAVRLGGKECVEDLVRLLRGQPHARIADGHEDLLVLSSLRLDDELP